MRIDRSKIRKTNSEVPPECQALIEKLRSCSREELLEELRKIDTWTFGKCELYHWIDILDLCDSILEAAATPVNPNSWQICVDLPKNKDYKQLVLWVLHFTTMLIEHSFSRHLYNSVEHLLTLLTSCDLTVVLNVLNLLYMFSKRSNYITRINLEKRNALLKCLTYLADTWGGEENGFGLADCVREGTTFPPTATTLHYEFYSEDKSTAGNSVASCIHLDNTDEIDKLPSEIMDGLIELFHVPKDGQMVLFTHLRLAHSFTNYGKRLKCVQARLQALSVLLYSNADSTNLLYPGLLKELVQVLQLNNPQFVEIRSAALRTLTSIIHLDRTPHLPKKPGSRLSAIIEATGANLYHGFLPQLVRSCITSLTTKNAQQQSQGEDRVEEFPLLLATALFSFLYHLASYETGGEALVSCGVMESLLRVVNWLGVDLDHITFVTRAVRVIDLITNIEMLNFQSQAGLNSFIYRLEMEVNTCRENQEGSEPCERQNQEDFLSHPFLTTEEEYVPSQASSQAQDSATSAPLLNVLEDDPDVDMFTNDFLTSEEEFEISQASTVINYELLEHRERVNSANQTSDCLERQPQQDSAASAPPFIVLEDDSDFDMEVNICREDQLFQISVPSEGQHQQESLPSPLHIEEEMADPDPDPDPGRITIDRMVVYNDSMASCSKDNILNEAKVKSPEESGKSIKICLPQRAALLKSMLNFLKKALQDPVFTENIRHVMDGPLPNCLKHIISNAEYYGPSLFLLATDVVAVYVFQEPSLLSSLQDIGLTDVVLHALLVKNVPATREVLGSVPNVFSALCLNTRGLNSFIKYKPFEKLFKVLLSSDYLPAMRRRRGSDAIGDTASNLGNAMDELMRHQPSLRSDAIAAIIKLLEELVHLGTDPKYVCWKTQKGCPIESPNPIPRSSTEGSSSDEEEEDEEEASTSSHTQRDDTSVPNTVVPSEKTPIALVDYVLHVMKFVDAILSNNSTDDHCKEFVNQNGLEPLLSILGLPNLPVEYPITQTVQAVASVCKSVLSLAQENSVMKQGLSQCTQVLGRLAPLMNRYNNSGSVLLEELYQAPFLESGFSDPSATPILHNMQATYGYVMMFIHICRSGQVGRGDTVEACIKKVEMRNLTMNQWSLKPGQIVLLQLSELYLSLIWETTVLHSCCTEYLCDKVQANNTEDAMDTSEEVMVDMTIVNKYTSNPLTPRYVKLKYVKPLLAASCRLGRAIAELFGLLVKMCVNTHARNRRGHHNNPLIPTTLGHTITETIGNLLEKAITPHYSPRGAELKLQLSYLICSLGFTQAILFDEKKYPYHLMLLKFMNNGGLDAFFLSYKWVMRFVIGVPYFSNPPNLPDGSVEFLSTWFLLLEKLTNPKAILETFHTTPTVVPRCHNFNVLFYLKKVHKMAFEALSSLWGCLSMAKYSPKIVETIITIYRHILRGEMHYQDPTEPWEFIREPFIHLTTDQLTQFSEGVLKTCLHYVEILPEAVFKISELFIMTVRRNGEQFCYKLLNTLASEISDAITEIIHKLGAVSSAKDYRGIFQLQETLLTSTWSVRIAGCLHIYMLIFEEIREPCAKVIHSADLLNSLLMLLEISANKIDEITPKWLAPLLLLIHQLEKVSIWINSKINMHMVTLPLWRWLDLNSGKWNNYVSANNKLINEAYWRGDRDVTITSSRRRYTVSFQTMCQITENSGKARPVMMAIMDSKDPSSKSNHENPIVKFPKWTSPRISDEEKEYDNTWALTDPEYYVDFFHRRGSWAPLMGLTSDQIYIVLKSCMILLAKPVDADTLHALMQVCVRYTRQYKRAQLVANKGVVQHLLKLTQASSFTGFVGLATMLIRHILEEPSNIATAMDRILRFKTLPNIPPTFKELNYILRECEPAISRNPDIFKKVAKDIMRVDISALNKRSEEDDQRLLMKCLPADTQKSNCSNKEESPCVRSTITQLLDALLHIHQLEVAAAAAAQSSQGGQQEVSRNDEQFPTPCSNARNDLEPDLDAFSISTLSMYLAASFPISTYYTNQKKSLSINQQEKKTYLPLLTISNILKMLGDTVRSYNPIAKMIMEHKYIAKQNDIITEDHSVVAFVLDQLMPSKEDQDRMNMCRNLMAAIASCNHSPDSQCQLVTEVKAALSRTLAWPESTKKHTHIQDLVVIISTMIENCPPVPITSAPLSPALKLNQYSVNNMVKFMAKKGIVTDLARITLSLDLSSPKMAFTINAALKPLETLARIMSQPSGISSTSPAKAKPKTGHLNQGSTSTGNTCQDAIQVMQLDTGPCVNVDSVDDESGDMDSQPELIDAMINRVVGTMNNMGGLMHNVLERNRIPNLRIQRRLRGRGQGRVISELSRFGSIFSSSSDLNSFSNNDEMSQDSSSDESDSNTIDQSRHADDMNTDLEDPAEEEEDEEEEDDDDDEDEEEEDDEDEEEDDDEDDDDQGDTNEGEESNGVYSNEDRLFESDEDMFGIRAGLDRESGDEFLMIEYSEPDSAAPWSRDSFLPFSIFDDGSGNNRIPIQHPLLTARHTGDQPTSSTNTTRSQRMSRARRYQYVQMNRASVASPVIFQRLISQNATDPPNYLNIPGHPGNTYGDMLASTFPNTRLIVLENGLGILTNSEEEQINFVDQSGYLLGPSLAATLSNVPTSMYWWNEELRLLDPSTVIECSSSMIVGYDLAPEFERYRNEEFSERKGKRKKMDDDDDSNKKSNGCNGETEKKKFYDGVCTIFEPPRTITRQQPRRLSMLSAAHEVAQATENLAGSIVDSVLHPLPPEPQSEARDMMDHSENIINSVSEAPSEGVASGFTDQLIPPQALELIPVGPSIIPELELDTTSMLPDIPFPLESDPEEDRFFRELTAEPMISSVEVSPAAAEVPRQLPIPGFSPGIPLSDLYRVRQREEPGPSSSQLTIAEDEVPDGVDPSFLAALPEEIRAEVLTEHLRLQRFQNRIQLSEQSRNSTGTEVSADFLAALPPSIQEEVLAQQRLEQQRLANPNDPVDAAAFFQDLPPPLRLAILSDMEESQISVLPPELAAEAHTLQREWQARNRQLMQERFLSHVSNNTSALSSILRHTGSRNARRATGPRYTIQNMGAANRSHWLTSWNFGARLLDNTQSQSGSNSGVVTRPRGRQVLDPESISCLLVLLCVDDSRINTTRLHKVFRHLCYHQPTRDWLIRAILSIMEKCNESQVQVRSETGRMITRSQSQQNSENQTAIPNSSVAQSGSSWLNIGMDAALGCRATVFHVNKIPGRRYDKTISINPHAAPLVYGHTLDLLISLGRAFPQYFVPSKGTGTVTPPKTTKSPRTDNFWDLLLRLDALSRSKTGKSMPRSSGFPPTDTDNQSLENSSFGQLLKMLASPVVHRSSLLMDKLLRLLSHISISLHVRPLRILEKLEFTPDIKASCAEVINIITAEDCSEDGLESATALLINIVVSLIESRNHVLEKLLEGAHMMGLRVCRDISKLLEELRVHNSHVRHEDSTDEQLVVYYCIKGILNNRFTKDKVVITAPKGIKGAPDLQLPTMAPLVSTKTSSQTKFLRILKVIVQLKDSIKNFDKKKRKEAAEEAARVSAEQRPSNREESQENTAMDLATADTQPLPSSASSNYEDKPELNLNFSERLILEELWETLSQCLTELQLTQDTHAVLILQPAVEAFFLVHASAVENENPVENENTVVVVSHNSSQSTQETVNLGPFEQHEVRSPINYAHFVQSPVSAASISDSPHNTWDELSEGRQSNSQAEVSRNSGLFQNTIPSSQESNVGRQGLGLEGLSNTPPPVSPLPSDNADSVVIASTSSGFSSSQSTSIIKTESNMSKHQQKFLKFAEKHRTVLNQILRQSTTHLLEGPFKVLVNHTRVLDFDVKRRYFRNELERADEGHRREELAVHVRRNQVFEESFRELYRRSPDEWKNRFYIVFEGEEGQDAGGLLREWYVIISREIFNPMYALFTTSPGDRVTYMINPSSHYNPNHLCYFKFVGRVIAKAIYDNKLLECYFTRSFYKHILGIHVKYTDMESEDYAFYKGLVYLMENHVDSLGYECVFSLEVQEFGVTEVRELIPNGRNIPVTEKNKMEYIRLVCQMKMTGNIRKQLNAFLEGFYDIIPKKLISIFNEQELELLISGLPNVDIEDLKTNTEYYKYQNNSLQIQWFWRALREFDQAERAKFLQFVTGTSKVPLQGFAALEGMNGVQKFQIHRDERSTDRLPSAHTCFNQLDLPVYETYTKLKHYLLKAIHECSEGFGFA